jgi:hypothetical protein
VGESPQQPLEIVAGADPVLRCGAIAISAGAVTSVHAVFAPAEGFTLVVVDAEGASAVAPLSRLAPDRLRLFVDAAQANGRHIRIPGALRGL